MAVRIVKPVTPGRRNMSFASFEEITKTKPEKALTMKSKSNAGRNNQGKMTVAHRGSGVKRRYRLIDFRRIDKMNIPGLVKAIEYDPNRTSYIMLVTYRDGEKRYHLAPETIKVNDQIMTAERTKIKTGNRMRLKNIPVGYSIHDIELKEGCGGKIVRSAGSFAKIAAIEGDFALLQLPSGQMRAVSKECFGTIGVVSNLDHAIVRIGKAGRSRYMGRRPTVRGKAKNPVDHPHGGGEGNQPIGLVHPKTPWGKPALGVKTRKPKKYSNIFIHGKKF